MEIEKNTFYRLQKDDDDDDDNASSSSYCCLPQLISVYKFYILHAVKQSHRHRFVIIIL